ncbi:MAG TPA: hypothetical protein VNQ97_11835 [Burkholderiaceae bacterium]|nr:hypothetical protein [Burkholderiaceae bacterium]
MEFALDLTVYHRVRQHGDITAYQTWFGPEQRPALVLIPTYRQHHEKTTPCVVPLENAWKWDETVGDPQDCARTCVQFAAHLGLSYTSTLTCIRIASIIRDTLGELITIPPRPGAGSIIVADAIVTDSNGRERHFEITDNV